jgi:hypothetical protein
MVSCTRNPDGALTGTAIDRCVAPLLTHAHVTIVRLRAEGKTVHLQVYPHRQSDPLRGQVSEAASVQVRCTPPTNGASVPGATIETHALVHPQHFPLRCTLETEFILEYAREKVSVQYLDWECLVRRTRRTTRSMPFSERHSVQLTHSTFARCHDL